MIIIIMSILLFIIVAFVLLQVWVNSGDKPSMDWWHDMTEEEQLESQAREDRYKETGVVF